MASNASLLLRKAKTEQQLAQEILGGGLNPDLYAPETRKDPTRAIEEDETDEVVVQIKVLLNSAIASGQLRSLARAIVLAWQAGYDSELLRQAEPKMVKKAKEIQLENDFKSAIEQRNRVALNECLKRAEDLGLTESSYPILSDAAKLEKELEEEARNLQDAARPGHSKLMSSVIGELSSQMFGLDIDELQAKVVAHAVETKDAMDKQMAELSSDLELLEECKVKATSSEKLQDLKKLQESLERINPVRKDILIAELTETVEDLRADNTELLLAARNGGGVSLGHENDQAQQSEPNEELIAEIERLSSRITELEENEEVLRERIDQAAKLGAKWMEEKKDKEIAEVRAESAKLIDAAKEQVKAEVEADFKSELRRKSMEIEKQEKMAKVAALQGQEEALKRKFEAEVALLKEELDAADKKYKSLEKVMKLRG